MIEELELNVEIDNSVIEEAVRKSATFYKTVNEVRERLSLPKYKDAFGWLAFLLKCPFVGVYDGGIIAPAAIISSVDLEQRLQKAEGEQKLQVKKTYRIFYYHLLENPSDKIINRYLIGLSNILGEKTEGVPIQAPEVIVRQEAEAPVKKKKVGRKKKTDTGVIEQVIEIGEDNGNI